MHPRSAVKNVQNRVVILKFSLSLCLPFAPEVLDRLGPDGELDGGADRPQLEELRRELVAHEAADVGICLAVGGGGCGDLRPRRLGYLEERRVGSHVADLEAREVDAVDVGLGRAQVVLRYAS